jgi:hypothetical protein
MKTILIIYLSIAAIIFMANCLLYFFDDETKQEVKGMLWVAGTFANVALVLLSMVTIMTSLFWPVGLIKKLLYENPD